MDLDLVGEQPMMDYEKEIQRALLCLQINRGYEIPAESEVLDARVTHRLNAKLEEEAAELRRAQELLDSELADSDDEDECPVEGENEDVDEESGSESVHDYFAYSTSYPQHFINIQTLPINLQGAKRLDRCSSNDSGLGTSSLSPSQKQQVETSIPDSEPEEATPRRRFPKLGVSSLSTNNQTKAQAPVAPPTPPPPPIAESQSSSSEEEIEKNALRTSTPAASPTKDYVPSDWPQDQPLPTVEDMLYPGIKQQTPSPSRFTKNSKKILSGFKTRTSTGLLKLKTTVSDMMKSERDEVAQQQLAFDKITKTAQDEDDFSIHMIKEASLQRLTETTNNTTTKTETPQLGVFPPSGGRLLETCQEKPRTRRHRTSEVHRRSSSSPRNRLKKRLEVKSFEEQKRQKRNRKMISEVRRRVAEAHRRDNLNEKVLRVPAAYKPTGQNRPRVYTRGGQVPQYRNGELDWNYLWFFSDSSSATTNSTANSGDITLPASASQAAELSSTSSSVSSTINSSDSSLLLEDKHQVAPPPTLVSPRSDPSRRSPQHQLGVMRHATKKRIRKLAPPTDDNLTLLGMV